MKVTEQDVDYVAELANLELTAGERGRMVRDLNSILEYMEQLNRVDTGGVEPMAQSSDRFGIDESRAGSERFAYAVREDEIRPSLEREAVMKNAPESDGKFFKVPRVIEK